MYRHGVISLVACAAALLSCGDTTDTRVDGGNAPVGAQPEATRAASSQIEGGPPTTQVAVTLNSPSIAETAALARVVVLGEVVGLSESRWNSKDGLNWEPVGEDGFAFQYRLAEIDITEAWVGETAGKLTILLEGSGRPEDQDPRVIASGLPDGLTYETRSGPVALGDELVLALVPLQLRLSDGSTSEQLTPFGAQYGIWYIDGDSARRFADEGDTDVAVLRDVLTGSVGPEVIEDTTTTSTSSATGPEATRPLPSLETAEDLGRILTEPSVTVRGMPEGGLVQVEFTASVGENPYVLAAPTPIVDQGAAFLVLPYKDEFLVLALAPDSAKRVLVGAASRLDLDLTGSTIDGVRPVAFLASESPTRLEWE
jgi:hypothetical protein